MSRPPRDDGSWAVWQVCLFILGAVAICTASFLLDRCQRQWQVERLADELQKRGVTPR